ncbi:erythromycin esterase family protein [Streptomyces sp. NPDC058466]|uniref:erythromycin esterase family protein n=1 Tax=unclassified Streptomyces TaxID=2593676 RepID=UPI0036585CBF
MLFPFHWCTERFRYGPYLSARRPRLFSSAERQSRGYSPRARCPRPPAGAGTYIEQYLDKPFTERKEMAVRTAEALNLLRQQPPGADRDAYDWAVQNATAIDQTARGYGFDFEDQTQIAASMRYRDSVMASDVAWWERHTGTKVLLSAHDAHVGYEPVDPADYPKMQGAFLRDSLGRAYVSVGLTFGRGSFNATGPDGKVRRFTVGPAGTGTNERTLDRVRYRDYVLDLRTAASQAREWLNGARPTRSIGTDYPDGPYDIALAPSHDILIHLHRVAAARLRDR